jgi:hypothetical protein
MHSFKIEQLENETRSIEVSSYVFRVYTTDHQKWFYSMMKNRDGVCNAEGAYIIEDEVELCLSILDAMGDVAMFPESLLLFLWDLIDLKRVQHSAMSMTLIFENKIYRAQICRELLHA